MNFIGSIAIKPLTSAIEGINAPSAYVGFNANARSILKANI